MRLPLRRSIYSLVGCLIVSLLFAELRVRAAVTVQTQDGREITGEVDAETDEERLWIRQEREQIVLTTSLRWSEITAVHNGQTQLPMDQLVDLLRAQATEEPAGFLLHQTMIATASECEGDCLSKNHARTQRVRSIEIEAHLVNLDRDVEPDGLELWIAALDERGQPVPVKGSLQARLIGERIQPHGSLVRYEDLQRWSQRVRGDDFDADGLASYRLRFRTVRPEFDLALHSDALINVRLTVSGQGNFEASVPVQIRAFNPVRDRLQLTRGGRFFPDELTQQTRHQLPHRTHTRQLRTR